MDSRASQGRRTGDRSHQHARAACAVLSPHRHTLPFPALPLPRKVLPVDCGQGSLAQGAGQSGGKGRLVLVFLAPSCWSGRPLCPLPSSQLLPQGSRIPPPPVPSPWGWARQPAVPLHSQVDSHSQSVFPTAY